MEKLSPIPTNSFPIITGTQEDNASPFSEQTVSLPKDELIKLKWKANYFEALAKKLQKDVADLKKELEAERAKNRDLNQRLYGKKSEKSKQTESCKPESSNNRGHQKGAKGHGRTPQPYLPVIEEFHELSLDDKTCPKCGKPFIPFGSEDSEVKEIYVRPYIRRIRRERCKKGCKCEGVAGIITAPPAPKVIPKGQSGVSVFTEVLVKKYQHSIPLNRIIEEFSQQGMPTAAGTITGELKKIAPLFEPVIEAAYEKQMDEAVFHADETRWEVFEQIDEKTGHRWYLWVVRSVSVVFYRMAPTRGADVPKIHFAGIKSLEIVVVCDRYTAYKSLASDYEEVNIVLAFCWAHVRRDFLDLARSYPEFEQWCFEWVEMIRELYQINGERLKEWNCDLSIEEQNQTFTEHHENMRTILLQMEAQTEAELATVGLHGAKKEVIKSLDKHWGGLIVFFENPEIPMDNNAAERAIRNPVTGRKNYYGSGSVWSSQLAAMMFTIIQTILLWGLNPRHWLYAFLQACAENGGSTPLDLSPFLPWEMDEERMELFAQPLTLEPLDSDIWSREPETLDSS